MTIIITGPTGVGKSDTALMLARLLKGQIINADVGQLYTPLTIGTAKPDYATSPIPHHCFDVLDTPQDYSVAQYREQVLTISAAIKAQGDVPIIVGGSCFYIKSLLYPPRAPSRGAPTGPVSWQALNAIDPVRAKAIHPHDTYRIQRALAIGEQTGQPPSQAAPQLEVPDPLLLIILERDDLYPRINERVHTMIANGWIEEVAALRKSPWEPWLMHKKIIGYDTIITYLQQEPHTRKKDQLIATIQQRTRHYAKYQRSYLRSMVRQLNTSKQEQPHLPVQITTVNLTLAPHDLYINQLLKQYHDLSITKGAL